MSLRVTHGMVLAAGLGTRMRPLTNECPKPLIEVAGRSLLDRALDQFFQHNLQHVVVNSHYLAPMIADHLAPYGEAVRISYEPERLETGGGIAHALPLLGSTPFAVLNSDTVCLDTMPTALQRMEAAWDEACDMLLLLHPREAAIGYDGPGDFFCDDAGRIKRRGDAPTAPYVFTGVQLLHPRLFAHAPQGAFSMNLLYNTGFDESGWSTPRLRAIEHDGDWVHVGTPEQLEAAERFFSDTVRSRASQ